MIWPWIILVGVAAEFAVAAVGIALAQLRTRSGQSDDAQRFLGIDVNKQAENDGSRLSQTHE